MTSYVYSWDAEIWTTEKTDQYPNYSILSPQIFNNNIWFKPFSFWFFVRSWVSIILRDFMQNTNNFQADTTFFRTSDNLFEIKTHYTLKNTVFFYGAHWYKISIFVQTLNFDEIYSNIEFEFSRQKRDYWELDFMNKNWDFATVCSKIFLGIFKHWKRANWLKVS